MALNFPNNPQPGDSYTGDNGVIYSYDGIKWAGTGVEPGLALPIASTTSAGVVKIDGTTITIANSVITAVGVGGANTGNVTFDNTTIIGDNDNIYFQPNIAQPSLVWSIQNNTFGANSSILIAPASDDQYQGQIIFPGANLGAGILAWAGNIGSPFDNSMVMIGAGGNVTIGSQDGPTSSYWKFGTDGNLTLPLGSKIAESTSPTGVGNTITLTPNGGIATQALLIYPTAIGEGDHVHLTAGGGSTELYLGNDNQYVKLINGGDIGIRTDDSAGNSHSWTFGTDGNVTVPSGTHFIAPTNSNISLRSTGITGNTHIEWHEGADRATVKYSADGVEVYTTSEGIQRSWKFHPDGSTHFPQYTFPLGPGADGDYLETNGLGVLSWVPGISLTQLKLIVASSNSWEQFQANIAAL